MHSNANSFTVSGKNGFRCELDLTNIIMMRLNKTQPCLACGTGKPGSRGMEIQKKSNFLLKFVSGRKSEKQQCFDLVTKHPRRTAQKN